MSLSRDCRGGCCLSVGVCFVACLWVFVLLRLFCVFCGCVCLWSLFCGCGSACGVCLCLFLLRVCLCVCVCVCVCLGLCLCDMIPSMIALYCRAAFTTMSHVLILSMHVFSVSFISSSSVVGSLNTKYNDLCVASVPSLGSCEGTHWYYFAKNQR